MAASGDVPTRGVFVSFEGGEGAGKSTQIARLRAHLEAAGHSVLTTREPGGSVKAEGIRSILLSGKAKHLSPIGETILFAAARQDHVRTVIEPALSRGQAVLCDRFVDSTRVYQGAVAGIETMLLDRLELAATGGTRPDATILIDVPAATGLDRARSRRAARGEEPDRFEAESTAYHERVRAAFLAIAASDPARCLVVDGSGTAEQVSALIWTALASRFGLGDGEGR